MVNTHILPQEFQYHEPHTLAEAVSLLQTHGAAAKIIAGGTDLLVQMKLGKITPQHLIQISKISELHFLTAGKGLHIGPLIVFRELEKSPLVRGKYTALFEAAHSVTSVQIRNMGTLAGNLCHASPASDSAPALIALGAQIRMISAKGTKTLPLEEFYVGPGKTHLLPHELLVEIHIPDTGSAAGSAFLKLTRVAADLAKVNAAAFIEREKDVCRECRIVMGAVAPKPLRLKQAEEILKNKRFEENLCRMAGKKAAEEIRPITDIRSTAWYRQEVTKVIVRDVLKEAWMCASRTS